MLDRLFPLWRNRNIAIFYILNGVISSWFVAGVWVFIWGKFMTNQEIGLSDSLTFAAGMLLELPSGVIGDLVGRKRTILFGHVCLVVGNLMVALSSSFTSIMLWYLLWTVGYAFQSGTTEALAYDSLSKKEQKNDWPRIISRALVIDRTMSVLATAAGGMLFAVHFRLPYLVAAAFGLIGVTAALMLRERKPAHKHKLRELATYTTQIRHGVGILARKAVWPIALACLSVMSISIVYNWGLLRPMTTLRFGFTETTAPLIQAVCSLASALALVYVARLHKKLGVNRMIFLAAITFGVVFASFCIPYPVVLGGMALIVAAVLATFVEQLFSVFVNSHTQAEHRATTLSAVSLITRAPFVVTAMIIGILADHNQLAPFTLGLGVFVLLMCAIAIIGYRRVSAQAKT